MNYRTLILAVGVEAIALAAAAQSVSVSTATVTTSATSPPAIHVLSATTPATTAAPQTTPSSRVRVLTAGAARTVQPSAQIVESPLVRAAREAKSNRSKSATMVIDAKSVKSTLASDADTSGDRAENADREERERLRLRSLDDESRARYEATREEREEAARQRELRYAGAEATANPNGSQRD